MADNLIQMLDMIRKKKAAAKEARPTDRQAAFDRTYGTDTLAPRPNRADSIYLDLTPKPKAETVRTPEQILDDIGSNAILDKLNGVADPDSTLNIIQEGKTRLQPRTADERLSERLKNRTASTADSIKAGYLPRAAQLPKSIQLIQKRNQYAPGSEEYEAVDSELKTVISPGKDFDNLTDREYVEGYRKAIERRDKILNSDRQDPIIAGLMEKAGLNYDAGGPLDESMKEQLLEVNAIELEKYGVKVKEMTDRDDAVKLKEEQDLSFRIIDSLEASKPAADNSGKKFMEKATGKWFISDGNTWEEIVPPKK